MEAKEAGKIGHIGATAHGLEAFARLIREYEDKIETMMFPYSIVENQAADLMKECTEKNIGFIGSCVHYAYKLFTCILCR